MRIIYQNDKGEVSVIIPAPDCRYSMEELSKKCVPEGKNYKIIEDSDLPKDRFFRNAWEYDDEEGITVSFTKAQELTKERLRAERLPLLQEQDYLFLIALEKGEDTKQIVEEKQRLRDITSKVELCKTLEELKTLNCKGIVK